MKVLTHASKRVMTVLVSKPFHRSFSQAQRICCKRTKPVSVSRQDVIQHALKSSVYYVVAGTVTLLHATVLRTQDRYGRGRDLTRSCIVASLATHFDVAHMM